MNYINSCRGVYICFLNIDLERSMTKCIDTKFRFIFVIVNLNNIFPINHFLFKILDKSNTLFPNFIIYGGLQKF